MSVVIEARDDMVEQLINLNPGSEEMLRQAQAIKIMSEIDRDDRKLDFDVEKEETRKLERANELAYSDFEMELKKIDRAISIVEAILNPGATIAKTFMNNRVRIKRDIMGYTYEETGVIGSHTFNNAQKDKYD